MAIYNGYPYTPYYPQTPQNYNPVQNNGIIWVQGEAGAKSYLVAPNSTVQLWDSEAQTIYLKSSDVSGMPSMKVLDYTIRDSAKTGPVTASKPQAEDLSNYATKAEIGQLKAEIGYLKSKIEKREVVTDE